MNTTRITSVTRLLLGRDRRPKHDEDEDADLEQPVNDLLLEEGALDDHLPESVVIDEDWTGGTGPCTTNA